MFVILNESMIDGLQPRSEVRNFHFLGEFDRLRSRFFSSTKKEYEESQSRQTENLRASSED
eukprot:Awhi_evm1s11380